MMVYVESNFLLEMVFEQPDSAAAEAILTHAESSSIELAMPTMALVEPFATLRYRNSERREVLDSWSHTMNRLKPNRLHDLGLVVAKDRLDSSLVDAYGDAADIVRRRSSRLDEVVDRVISVTTVLSVGASEFRRAIDYRQFGLDVVDSLIYVTVITHLEQTSAGTASCFVSRDKKGFANQRISAELATHGSRYISTFTNALNFIQSNLHAEEPPT
ncbi:MAG TPA: hypothetical protein VJO13_08975 [Ktedonobacterales bacterium]|nr:hypothetical protein [Ktedonobacterales bacterium]